MYNWRIHSLAFSGGEIVPLEAGSICLLIGPNSSGKSAGLRNLQALLQGSAGPHQVVRQATVTRTGTIEDFRAWFDANYPVRNYQGARHYVTRQAAIPQSTLEQHWPQGDLMPSLWQFLSTSLDTASRTSITNYTQAIDVWNNPPQAYAHVLQTDPELQAKVNTEMRAAFNRELVIDWTAAPSVDFRVGQEPNRSLENDRVSEQYATALQELPRLDEDGDGIKGFAGCLLATYCGSQPVLMIDEPEAFLHPPQARRLGAALARAAKESSRQVIVATHSADIVQGALNTDGRVSVCRLTRNGATNNVAILESADLSRLWSKPLLRSAAAIDGLFHAGVVICEADADVRLYEAVLRRSESKKLLTAPDLFFTQGGGKGELPTLAGAYATLSTRCAVIADIDLLRNPVEHHKCLAALGASLETEDPRYKAVIAALKDAAPLKSIEDAATDIKLVVDEFLAAGKVSKRYKERISSALQQSSTFSEAKRYGIEKLRGQPLTFARELLEEWRQVGLFILPVGELESWWPEGPANDKNAWLTAAINLLQDDGSLSALESFMGDVAGYFGQP